MKIEINVHCYNYQHRLCWFLSSILQQKGDIPEITVSISYLKDNGSPKTEDVIAFFRGKGLNIVDVVIDEKNIGNRSFARNLRSKEITSDWVIYADGDMVYDPMFFADLKVKLLSRKYKNETGTLGADRYSLDDTFCIKYFEEDKRVYPCVVEEVALIVKDWKVKYWSGKRIAPGYFQLANVKSMKERNIEYPICSGDHFRKYRGDRAFRVSTGKVVPIDLLPQYHLNHSRGSPDIQR